MTRRSGISPLAITLIAGAAVLFAAHRQGCLPAMKATTLERIETTGGAWQTVEVLPNGVKHGEQTDYDPDGHVVGVTLFRFGTMVEWTQYRPDGTKAAHTYSAPDWSSVTDIFDEQGVLIDRQ